jgi:hypothetical protein
VETLLRLDLSGVPTDEETDKLEALLPPGQSYESSLVPTSEVLYITSNKYFGWAPNTFMEGDLICILKGVPEPYVLRPLPDGHFLLI